MLSKRIAVGLLVAVVAGVFSLSLPSNTATGEEQASTATTIQLGDFFFKGPAGQSGAFSAPEVNVATIGGAASGTIVLVFQNTGTLEHEVMSSLFFITTEAKIKSFDASGNEISKIESVGSLREVELQPGMRAEVTLVLDESLARSFEDDPNLSLQFEITCQVGHGTLADHYRAGMRGLITLTP